MDRVLLVEDLTKHYASGSRGLRRTRGKVKAVDGLNFSIERGETLAIVGESGSGKTTTAKLVLGLESPTGGRITTGIDSAGGPTVQAVFQDPWSSLDPRMRVGAIIAEPLLFQDSSSRAMRRRRVEELLDLVGLDLSSTERFPHQLSGGQRQRVAIARALASKPDLIVLDEPVSALDVSIRAQIINLLADIQDALRTSYLVISHDLATVRIGADQVAVMYAGRFVEYGTADALFDDPQHPYTQALFAASLPARPDRRRIDGAVSEPDATPPATSGCSFRLRCPLASKICETTDPKLIQVDEARLAACHLLNSAQ